LEAGTRGLHIRPEFGFGGEEHVEGSDCEGLFGFRHLLVAKIYFNSIKIGEFWGYFFLICDFEIVL
jgi:hypothetical protein